MAARWRRAPDAILAIRGRLLRSRASKRLESFPRPYQLCLGSGRAPIPGWTNIDYYFPADVTLDLRYGLPVGDGSTALIYSEHLIEHLSLEDNLGLFRECWRVLKPGGRMRMATPDLADLVNDYSTGWRRHDWVNWDEYDWVDSGVRMLNTAVREWGHLYMWDFDELSARLAEAGFGPAERFGIGESATDALRDLETRQDSGLVVEVVKSRNA